MVKLEPYITFNGNCEEAFSFYGKVFESEFTQFLRYKDVPGDDKFSDEEMERVLYIALPLGNSELMGSDAPGKLTVAPGENTALSVSMDMERQAISVFSELSEEGTIHMQLQKTFWADLYGIVTDRFGIRWIITYTANEE